MKIDKNIFFIILSPILFSMCHDENLEEFINAYKKEGDMKIEYFYKRIIANRNYKLLNDFILDEFNLYDPYDSDDDVFYWLGEGKDKTIKYIIQRQKNYCKFIAYEIKNRRYFYSWEEETYNIEYEIEVRYKKTTTKEIIILGFLKKGPHKLKLIAYSSRLKKEYH